MARKLKSALFFVALTIVRAFFFVFCPTKAIGKENIPKEGGVILCPNHVSMFDVVCLFLTCPRHIHFMAKAELFNHSIMRFLLDVAQAFPVARGRGDASAIIHSVDLINQGEVVGIFVEGTRVKNADGSPGKAKPGAIYIASQTQSDIIPVAICYKYNKPRIFCRNYVYYGSAIPSEAVKLEDKSKDRIRACCDIVMKEIVTLWKRGKARWQ